MQGIFDLVNHGSGRPTLYFSSHNRAWVSSKIKSFLQALIGDYGSSHLQMADNALELRLMASLPFPLSTKEKFFISTRPHLPFLVFFGVLPSIYVKSLPPF